MEERELLAVMAAIIWGRDGEIFGAGIEGCVIEASEILSRCDQEIYSRKIKKAEAFRGPRVGEETKE